MEIIRSIQSLASPELDSVALVITNLGSEYAYIALLLVGYLAVDSRFVRLLGISFCLGFYLNFVLKALFDTPRPFVNHPELLRGAEAEATSLGEAFPSGHAQSSFTFWLFWAWFLRRRWFWGVAILLVFLISLSRVYLGVHYPIDILGGWFFGALVIATAVYLSGHLRLSSLSRPWLFALGIALPFALHMFGDVPSSELFLGATAAFISGPLLIQHPTDGKLWGRIASAALGLVLVFGVLLGSSALLSDSLKDDKIVSFIRYFVVSSTGIVLTPYLARLLRLVSPTQSNSP